jgi:hypothetical protein
MRQITFRLKKDDVAFLVVDSRTDAYNVTWSADLVAEVNGLRGAFPISTKPLTLASGKGAVNVSGSLS